MKFMQWIELFMLPAPHTGRRVGNVVLKAGTAELDAIWCPPSQLDGLVVLLSHGNGEILEKSKWWFDEFKSHDYGLLMYDYAGYGGSSGKASEAQLELDAEAAYDFLTKEKGISPSRIIIMGYSMGSVPSCHLAKTKAFLGLVLCAPVASAWYLFFPFSMPNDIFRNTERLSKTHVPLLLFHGTHDSIVPFRNGKILFKSAACQPKCFNAVPGADHNNLFCCLGEMFWKKLNVFIQYCKHQGIPISNGLFES